MKHRSLVSLLAVAVAVALAGSATAADKYLFDKAHSSIEFSVKHMVVSNVKGTFDTFDGAIMYDPADIEKSSVDITIAVAGINTREAKRDEHLRSPDFFDAAKYPNITFKSSKIKKTDNGLVAVGTLTIRGVSKEVELPFTLNGPVVNPLGKTVIGVELAYQLNRRDFGVSWNKTLDAGGVVVGDDVKIEINLEATKG
jgi:polyisoprenoid-binding protein YceI